MSNGKEIIDPPISQMLQEEEVTQASFGIFQRVFQAQFRAGKERNKMDSHRAKAAEACMASNVTACLQATKGLATDVGG
jgi:hypothetical protein